MSNRIGNVLRVYRAQYDLEQQHLADQIGISTSTLCRLEQGKDVDMNHTAKIITWLFENPDAHASKRKIPVGIVGTTSND